MERKQIGCFYLATACLLLGSAFYIFFRPKTLLMFHWADSLGVKNSIRIMRALTDGFYGYLPSWTIYSLPFALYVLSYLFFIKAIWWKSEALACHAWFWSIPIIAIASEFAQVLHIIPGHFDFIDIVTIVIVSIIGFIFISPKRTNKGVMKL